MAINPVNNSNIISTTASQPATAKKADWIQKLPVNYSKTANLWNSSSERLVVRSAAKIAAVIVSVFETLKNIAYMVANVGISIANSAHRTLFTKPEPAQKPVEQPVQQLVELPAQKLVEQPVQLPVEQSVQLTVELQVEQPVVNPLNLDNNTTETTVVPPARNVFVRFFQVLGNNKSGVTAGTAAGAGAAYFTRSLAGETLGCVANSYVPGMVNNAALSIGLLPTCGTLATVGAGLGAALVVGLGAQAIANHFRKA
jgi:hypothetical protein